VNNVNERQRVSHASVPRQAQDGLSPSKAEAGLRAPASERAGGSGAKPLIVNIYGGARGNPGPAGYGALIQDAEGTVLDELYGGLGIATNNIAEYNGLLAALRWAVQHGHRKVHIRADSELLVKQMRGEYKVKNEGLKPLFLQACALIRSLGGDVTFEHVRREFNKEADRLSNLGMDEAEAALKSS
jgi:probable phosphoglycerate mutase